MTPLKEKAASLFADVAALVADSEDFNEAFLLSKWLCQHLWKNPCGIYRDDRIENELFNKLPKLNPQLQEIDTDEIHIATTVYAGGGHTNLMRHYIATRKLENRITMLVASPKKDYAEAAFGSDAMRLQSTTLLERISELAALTASHKRAVLYIHPDDLETALAVKLAKTINPALRVTFVNHSDHVFSVGFSEANFVAEISGYGWSLRRDRQSEANSIFVGIPLSEHSLSGSTSAQALTAASSYKFKPNGKHSLPKLLAQVLKACPHFELTVVGAKIADVWWWPVRLKYRRRTTFLKSLPYAEYLALLAECKIYIDSFPVTGGTALPEALISGKPVIGISEGMSGYSPADDLKISIDKFVPQCIDLYENPEQSEQITARQQCRKHLNSNQVAERLNATLTSDNPHAAIPEFVTKKQPPVFEHSWQQEGKLLLSFRPWKKLSKQNQKRLLKALKQAFPKQVFLAYRVQHLLATP